MKFVEISGSHPCTTLLYIILTFHESWHESLPRQFVSGELNNHLNWTFEYLLMSSVLSKFQKRWYSLPCFTKGILENNETSSKLPKQTCRCYDYLLMSQKAEKSMRIRIKLQAAFTEQILTSNLIDGFHPSDYIDIVKLFANSNLIFSDLSHCQFKSCLT